MTTSILRSSVRELPTSTSASGAFGSAKGTGAAIIPLCSDWAAPDTTHLEGVSADDLIKRLGLVEEVRDARRDLGAHIDAGAATTLRALRLKAGLSQVELANQLQTQQPHVSQIESGKQEPKLLLAGRWAACIGVDINTFFEAFLAARHG